MPHTPKGNNDYVYVNDGVDTGKFLKRHVMMCDNPDAPSVAELRSIEQKELQTQGCDA